MKFKLWLNIATFAAIAVVLYFGRHEIAQAIERMRHLNPWVLVLIIPTQLFGFWAVAKMYEAYFKATDTPVPMKVLWPAAIELNFVNHIFPSGGVSGFSYLTYRLKQVGVSPAKSTLAQVTRYAFTFGTFIIVLMLAVFLLSLENHASGLIILIATSLTSTIVFGVVILLYVISSRNRTRAFLRVVVSVIDRGAQLMLHRHFKAANVQRLEKMVTELHTDYVALRHNFSRMRTILIWSFIGNLTEVGIIYIAFAAHGEFINPGAVAIGYAVAVLGGLVAILPGGVGVYEPLMVTVLLAAGVPAGLALSATLVARVCAMGVALSTGALLYQIALRRSGRSR